MRVVAGLIPSELCGAGDMKEANCLVRFKTFL